MRKKVLFSAGGTAGHLFPAQAAARMLTAEHEVFFSAAGLAQNPFFDSSFPFKEISSAPLRFSRSTLLLLKGFFESKRVLQQFSPDLIVAFGSFHVFPILAAACLLNIPFLLHEQNAAAGKVNRFFSSRANATIIVFPPSARDLKGKVICADWPKRLESDSVSPWEYYGLQKKFTLLAYGGSQGASFLNDLVVEALIHLSKKGWDFQVIHFAGKHGDASLIRNRYSSANIAASVKEFEKHPDRALCIADLAIARAGAGTISDLIDHELPAVLIPFAKASEDHQTKNGNYFIDSVGGGWLLQQNQASPLSLSHLIEQAFSDKIPFKKMQIQRYKETRGSLKPMHQIILDYLS